jgi:COMPASS component SWD3
VPLLYEFILSNNFSLRLFFELELYNKMAEEEFDGSNFKLVPKVTISGNTSEIFCVKFSPDGNFVAAGCGDGAIRVFNTQTGALAYNLQSGSNVALPTTSIKFRPVTPTTRTKNVILAANAAGTVQHWHMTSGKCLHSIEEEDSNQVFAMDYNLDGTRFVTAGKDTALRVYDEATKTLLLTMKGGGGFSVSGTPGHSNRIFSVRMVPHDENIIISGGWDNTVQYWDVRAGVAVKNIFGPHICGDALDIVNGRIVTGSWRPQHQLEIWDFMTGAPIAEIPWHILPNLPPCLLYAAQYSKEGTGRFLAAGGSGSNEAKVFDMGRDNAVVGTVTGLSRGVFTVDFSPESHKLAIGSGDASVRIFDIVPK